MAQKEYNPIYPCIWCKDNNSHEMADFYQSVFPDAIISERNYLVNIVTIRGHCIMLLNGNADFAPNPSISLVVECDTQEEIDYYWYRLTADGGKESVCGWLTDKYGVSWQITPSGLGTMIHKSPKVFEAMLQMKKLDIGKLKEAEESPQ